MNLLLIRADATERIGTGHLMRCLALAQAWLRGGGRVLFLSNVDGRETLKQRILEEGMDFVHMDATHPDPGDLNRTLSIVHEIKGMSTMSGDWLVLDGYHFDDEYEKAVKNEGLSLLVLDDYGHANHTGADLILNQNLTAERSLYGYRADETGLLLGPRYAMLRREFQAGRKSRRLFPHGAAKILVTMGGADPGNMTERVLDALSSQDSEGLEIRILIGPANPRFHFLTEQIDRYPFPCRFIQGARDVAEHMAWAEMAITAAGSTCWELCFLGVPSLVITTAENQRSIGERLHTAGAAIHLGWHEDISPESLSQAIRDFIFDEAHRCSLGENALLLVDGRGAERVVVAMRGHRISLRPVLEEDKDRIWRWANEEDVRHMSFTQGTISWQDHILWFRGKMQDPRCFFRLAYQDGGRPVGQVRIDAERGDAVLSVSVDQELRGCGYGSAVIREAVQEYFASTGTSSINAYVKQENVASLRAFLNAGFSQVDMVEVPGEQPIRLNITRKASTL